MRLRQRLWNPYAIVFISSACIMVLELVASRLIAPQLGVSLYTWTSVIGVILAGISLGNYLGGRLADRYASPRFLGLIFALAALGSLSVLWLNSKMGNINLPRAIPLLLWVVAFIAAEFFVPSTILGCVSPIVVKLSLKDLQRSGTTVGKIYAWSSVGSIVGTFATGFFLISWFGTKTIVLIIAGVLLALALWFLTDTTPRQAILSALAALVLVGGAAGGLWRGGFLCRDCLLETNYFCIKVNTIQEGYDQIEGFETIRELVLDRLVHSYSNLQNPLSLRYGYEQTYALVIEPMLAQKPDLAAFFIGGGGYTFPRYLEAKAPQSHLVVAEIDPGVTAVAHAYLGLREDTRIITHNMDARLFMRWYSAPDSYDLIFGDAFNDYSVPYHLTTLEFTQLVDRLLRDDGLYLANIIDGGAHGHFLRAFVRTVRQVFPYVEVIPSIQGWREAARSTFVIVASHRPLDLSYLPEGALLLSHEELEAYLAQGKPVILTDDYVPVDNFLAPVFEDSNRG